MDDRDSHLKRHTLSSRLAKLSPAKQALLERWQQGKSLSTPRITQVGIERVARNQELPLSFLLEDVMNQFSSNPACDMGSQSTCFRLMGVFNEAAMEVAINELVRRHETLRTSFRFIDGRPVQVIAPPTTLRIPVIDVQDIPKAERLGEALRILAGAAQRRYDPSKDSLWRVLLVRLDKSEHLLLFSVSHLIADGLSLDLLVKDSWILYGAFSTGRPSPLKELPVQFADYAYWQRKKLQGRVLEDLISYWKRQLDGINLIPEVRLPFERPLSTESSKRTVETQHLQVPAALLESLRELCRREGVTLFMVIFAALITILHRYSGHNDFGILSPAANRYRPETREVVGWFADYIVLRVRVPAVGTFSDLLKHVRNVVLEAHEHQALPFSKFYGHTPDIWNKASLYSSIRFNMMIGTERREVNAPQSGGAAQIPGLVVTLIEPPQSPTSMSPPGLAVSVRETEKQLHVSITHELERHEAAAIRELLQNYLIVLEGAAVSPEQRLVEFPLVLKTVQQ